MSTLSHAETLRYSRHLILPEVGLAGQERLKAGRVLLVGVGGLGSPVALYLAAAGVGRIGLVDSDAVDQSNLHRQVIHGTSDVGRGKLESAEETIHDLNPFVEVEKHEVYLRSDNALDILRHYDIVVDGTDNFPTRYLVNDACVLLGKPNAYGSIFRFEGQATVFAMPGGPCYRCLYPEPPPPGTVPSCAEGGVLGVLPGVIGLVQATETIKLLLGKGDPLVGRLLLFDALGMRFQEIKIKKDPQCPVCGESPSVRELIDYESFCGVPREGDPVVATITDMTVKELASKIGRSEDFDLVDVREPNEFEINRIPGARLVPMNQVPSRLEEFDKHRTTVVMCHTGRRSSHVCDYLRSVGFQDVHNLDGGISAWIKEIDPSMPDY